MRDLWKQTQPSAVLSIRPCVADLTVCSGDYRIPAYTAVAYNKTWYTNTKITHPRPLNRCSMLGFSATGMITISNDTLSDSSRRDIYNDALFGIGTLAALGEIEL